MPQSVLSSARGGMSREDYEAVRDDVVKRMEETASGILGGRIGINPVRDKNTLACNNCEFKSVCRRARGYVKNSARIIKPAPDKEDKEETDNVD
jgi:ATP-dependent helicase/DNAse subunit B